MIGKAIDLCGRPMEDTIIYEMHVRGFTRSPSSGVGHPGTFSGIIEKIPHLRELGITAVELLPVCDFDETEVLRFVDGNALHNFWGTARLVFSLHNRATASLRKLGISSMISRHGQGASQAGIEVILDVVFNHTDEGNEFGRSSASREIDNLSYYILEHDKRLYANYTGVGTL